eukprot:CAMPEP_0119550130 /NCGR_PEP_ID=MMETSP1352-20130426/3712_1 /TAXON_ID=265584 /ORGANISM="Stauroneis constricta, Strain CCMP1120" /LENGTH=244 /DNA_ID=CAMNT_0007595887 /DNA_START=25 /DNA_END=762 /DNA_ORIENTATION=+
MPQKTAKKKKGHTPAHQNAFAYKHNPKSKLTQKILESPNIHVCRRCHEKVEWRKQYRKYKPRTQPGKCNECQRRNVLAAYHTICTKCTTESKKAKALIREKADDDDDAAAYLRACAICVKEIALPDPEDEDEEDLIKSLGKIRLREKRAIERQLAKEADGSSNTKSKETSDQKTAEVQNGDNASGNNGGDETNQLPSIHEQADDSDDDDPFLQAIGGADKLLTGIEYQKKLLEREQHRIQQQQQ